MTPRAGRALRTVRQMDRAGAALCASGCRCGQHYELPRSDPRYRPLLFICRPECGRCTGYERKATR